MSGASKANHGLITAAQACHGLIPPWCALLSVLFDAHYWRIVGFV
ncbi:hypothetical protein BMETH_1092_0 [methanotrophic bacterial endosymbiont of Bathymodiolus sp.]|nr:hypothetical protein BMETH_1092_0 [methanotrophic bacterial endosymbiont of Bathymodiolus sp.]